MDHSKSYIQSEDVKEALGHLYREIEKLEKEVDDLEGRVDDLENARR